jgi:tetratricopeptide (TPR) repeat protein
VGFALLELGQYARSERVLAEALAEAERLGVPHLVGVARHNLGPVLARTGRVEEGRAQEEEAVRCFASQGERRLEGAARIYLSEILGMLGQHGEAEMEALEAARILEEAAPPLRPYGLASVALARLAAGRVGDALEPAREAFTEVIRTDNRTEGAFAARLAYVEALAATGDVDAAREHVVEARRALIEHATRIGHDGMRGAFLREVPENARILAWAERLLDETPDR